MRRPKRCALGIHHHDGFTRRRLAAIQNVAGKNPRVPGSQTRLAPLRLTRMICKFPV